MGLHSVRAKYGADSKQAAASAAMLRGTLAEVWAALHDATGALCDTIAACAASSLCKRATLPQKLSVATNVLLNIESAVSFLSLLLAATLCHRVHHPLNILRFNVHVSMSVNNTVACFVPQAAAWWRSWRRWMCGPTPSCLTCSSGCCSTARPSSGA